MEPTEQSKGMIGDLIAGVMDLSFSKFITPSIIKILFIILVIVMALGDLALLGGAFSQGFLAVVGALVLVPILFCVQVILARVYMELIIVAFRIEQNTRK